MEFSSAAKFVQYVVDFRENEKAWPRHLGEAILAARSWLNQGNLEAAKKMFNDFEVMCPWKMFVEITMTQRFNTLDDSGPSSA